MDVFVKSEAGQSTYFSVLPQELLLELEKYFYITLSIENYEDADTGLLYATLETSSFTIPMSWDLCIDEVKQFFKIYEYWHNSCTFTLEGYRDTINLVYEKDYQVTFQYEDRFSINGKRRLFNLKADMITSLIIMKKLKFFAIDIENAEVKEIY